MIKFKGRSSLKQYLPMKPIKRGFKVWVRADSHNGYLCNFEIYTGKEDSVETNLGAKVVKKLSMTLVGKRYHLYFDNFFSSVSIMEDLLEDELYACGTFRKDRRGLPQANVKTTLGRWITNIIHWCWIGACNDTKHTFFPRRASTGRVQVSAEGQLGRDNMARQEVSIHNVNECISHCYNNRQVLNQGWPC